MAEIPVIGDFRRPRRAVRAAMLKKAAAFGSRGNQSAATGRFSPMEAQVTQETTDVTPPRLPERA
jgi:hypothetical protein